ncbi:MAG: IclR family transcriptional regulator C-terminal domain-containing protein, partial [Bryobacteraceae bacterium]
DIIYVERVQANLVRLGVSVRVGSRIPAYCTALGHCILAHIPLEKRLEILNSRERHKLTPRTPVTIADIEERIDAVRKLGYALNDQDTVSGLRVLAAPILDTDRHPFAAVSVAAPSVASSLEEFVSSVAGPVMRAASELGRLLSVSGSSGAAS